MRIFLHESLEDDLSLVRQRVRPMKLRRAFKGVRYELDYLYEQQPAGAEPSEDEKDRELFAKVALLKNPAWPKRVLRQYTETHAAMNRMRKEHSRKRVAAHRLPCNASHGTVWCRAEVSQMKEKAAAAEQERIRIERRNAKAPDNPLLMELLAKTAAVQAEYAERFMESVAYTTAFDASVVAMIDPSLDAPLLIRQADQAAQTSGDKFLKVDRHDLLKALAVILAAK